MGRRLTRRTIADIYLWAVILLGAAGLALFRPPLQELQVLFTLMALFALAEYFPTRVRVGAITFSFPMAYAAFILYGPAAAAWVAAGGTVLANLARRRAWRVVLFNATQFAVAALVAGSLTDSMHPLSSARLLLTLLLYYAINNGLVDGILWLRLRIYQWSDWLIKTRYELISGGVSLGYSLLMVLLAPQQRGHDPLTLLFFFLPLLTVGGFVRLMTHLSSFAGHIAALMEVSTLATSAPESQALSAALKRLDAFDDYRFAAIYRLEGDLLSLQAHRAPGPDGLPRERLTLGEGLTGWVAARGTPVFTGDAKGDTRNTIGEGYSEGAASMGAIPLYSSGQVIGVFTFGKERPQAIQPEDIRLLTTFANLVAGILRNMNLAQERERLLLEQERNRLSREIHDGLAQSLAGSLLQMDRLERLIETDRAAALKRLTLMREQLRELLLEVRRSVYNLRPSAVESHGLVDALAHEISRLREKVASSATDIRFEVRGEPRRLSDLVEDEVFRIAQEGVTNALKHAGATEVVITLQFTADRLRLTIRDNGGGFHLADAVRAAREGISFGLTGMSERAERLGATFDVDARPDSGTRVTTDVPLMGE